MSKLWGEAWIMRYSSIASLVVRGLAFSVNSIVGQLATRQSQIVRWFGFDLPCIFVFSYPLAHPTCLWVVILPHHSLGPWRWIAWLWFFPYQNDTSWWCQLCLILVVCNKICPIIVWKCYCQSHKEQMSKCWRGNGSHTLRGIKLGQVAPSSVYLPFIGDMNLSFISQRHQPHWSKGLVLKNDYQAIWGHRGVHEHHIHQDILKDGRWHHGWNTSREKQLYMKTWHEDLKTIKR